MNWKDEKNLGNPVWHSLNETHQSFAVRFNNLKCYQPDYCPFGGYTGTYEISKDIDSYAKLAGTFLW